MNKLRVAVIGAGHLGKIHSRLISSIDSVDLIAVADPNPDARVDVRRQVDAKTVADYRQVADRLDAAIIATPTGTHHRIAADLLERGVHLLIEKPMTDSVADAESLVELAESQGCIVQVGHVEQFNSAILVALAEVGKPEFIVTERMSGYTFRSTDIGVVHDLMIHDIELVNSFFEGSANDVRANGIAMFGGHEDIAQARIQFDCGAVANLTASRCSFAAKRQLQIFGTSGYARVDLAKHQIELVRVPRWLRNREFDFSSANPEQQAFVREQLFQQILPLETLTVEPVNAILAEQQEWIDAIRHGYQPTVNVNRGLEAVRIADRVLQQIDAQEFQTLPRDTSHPQFSRSNPIPVELQQTVAIRRAA